MFMRKAILFFSLIIPICFDAWSQTAPGEINRLKKALAAATSDSSRLEILSNLAGGYRFSNIDSTIYYSGQIIALSKKVHALQIEALTVSAMGSMQLELGNLPGAMKLQFQAM